MKIFEKADDVPWFVAGLAFECVECGRCCAGPEEGYVWATEDELDEIATYLKMTPKVFRKKYVRRVGRGFSLIEKKSKDCIFLENGRCSIYSVRPTQCRTWPFWHSNLKEPDDWAMAGMRCLGINRGPLHPAVDILKKADATRE
ncbi:MAG: YkgJ family cysteine cluster protein [Phycisphaerae bacterium]|nr:YkgJ family cysteine cluster protein [Phycisphaerae bacterium]